MAYYLAIGSSLTDMQLLILLVLALKQIEQQDEVMRDFSTLSQTASSTELTSLSLTSLHTWNTLPSRNGGMIEQESPVQDDDIRREGPIARLLILYKIVDVACGFVSEHEGCDLIKMQMHIKYC